MQTIRLIIEPEEGQYFGRVYFEDNLIVYQGFTLEEVKSSFKGLLFDFHQLTEIEFEVVYDLSTFFKQYSYLSLSKIAEYAGVDEEIIQDYKLGDRYRILKNLTKLKKLSTSLQTDVSIVIKICQRAIPHSEKALQL